jgi:hypothetical protein
MSLPRYLSAAFIAAQLLSISGCMNTMITPYPTRWPPVLHWRDKSCGLQGEYRSIGQLEAKSLPPSSRETADLSSLLVEGKTGTRTKAGDLVRFTVEGSELVAYLVSENEQQQLVRSAQALSECAEKGSASFRFEAIVQSDPTLHKRIATVTFSSAADRSLVARLDLRFEAQSISLQPTKEESAWCRFDVL